MNYTVHYCDIYRILLTARHYLLELQKANDGYTPFKDKVLLNIIGYMMNQLDLSEAWYFKIEDAIANEEEED